MKKLLALILALLLLCSCGAQEEPVFNEQQNEQNIPESAEAEKQSEEPEIIAEHIAALNHFSLGDYGAKFEEDKYGTFLFTEFPENTGEIPDSVTFEKVTYGPEEKTVFEEYYLDPFERTVQLVTNYYSKQDVYDYIGRYLAKDIFEHDYYLDNFVELDGKLYCAVGNIGNIGVTYGNCKIISQTEDKMVVSAEVFVESMAQKEETTEIIFEKQNGNWIITFFGNISDFEEKQAKEIYDSEKHEEYLKDINERIASYRDGTFEPVENHHSAYPDDFPSLAKAESAAEECVALAWRKTVDSGRIIHDGALDYIVSIDKTHAIILEPAEFVGDWGTAYGFGNTGYLDSEEWGYESVYDWIKDTYDGSYSGIKVIAGLGLAEKGKPISDDEVKKVSKAFEPFHIEGGIGYPNLPANFLQDPFERPEEINAVSFVALAWRKTVDSGRIIHDGALDYIVSIDKTHAIILEPAEFVGDWGTAYGFGNTGYLDSEEWGYESVYDWIKDTYDGSYSGIKVIAGLGLAEKGKPISDDEVKKVSKAFEPFHIEGGIGYPNLPANFLQDPFERPEEINAVSFLYYFPSGLLITDEEEFEDLKKVWDSYGRGVREGTKIEDHPVPLHKIPKEMVDEAAEKYLGIAFEELRYSGLDTLAENGIYYMEKYDCFYSTASDAHGAGFICESGEEYSDGTVILYGEYGRTLALKKHSDGSYKIYSYQR